eukprot:2598311-Rhodomonas_salina.1
MAVTWPKFAVTRVKMAAVWLKMAGPAGVVGEHHFLPPRYVLLLRYGLRVQPTAAPLWPTRTAYCCSAMAYAYSLRYFSMRDPRSSTVYAHSLLGVTGGQTYAWHTTTPQSTLCRVWWYGMCGTEIAYGGTRKRCQRQ